MATPWLQPLLAVVNLHLGELKNEVGSWVVETAVVPRLKPSRPRFEAFFVGDEDLLGNTPRKLR